MNATFEASSSDIASCAQFPKTRDDIVCVLRYFIMNSPFLFLSTNNDGLSTPLDSSLQ